MLQVPGDKSHWFVVNKLGDVRLFDNKEDVATTSEFINLASRVETTCAECGLLGMAFHPDFPATPRVYLSYTSLQHPLGGPDSVVSEFTTRDGGLTLEDHSHRHPRHNGHGALSDPGRQSVRREHQSLRRERHRPAELSRDLRLGLSQSLEDEFRSRDRGPLAWRRR